MPNSSALRFARSHEWITPGSVIATVGISEHAQAELGDVVYLELPAMGRVVKAAEAVAVIESVKAASDIYAPVDGEIVEVNTAAADDTSLVNTAPYEGGWLFKLKVSDPAQVEALMTEADYLKFVV
jgi:glycine cleavage system H protein